MSSWESLRIWSSNSTLHSSKELSNLDLLDSNKLIKRKITAIDYYFNEDLCRNVFIWCDISRQTIYSGIVEFNENPYLSQLNKLLETNLGNHMRLAVDYLYRRVYLALYEFSRIDLFDIRTNISTNFLPNISRPVDIAIDSELQVLFWIENWTCISHLVISNMSTTRMCSSKPRALAVDVMNAQLYWSDSDGNLFRKNYFDLKNQIIISDKKMSQNYALDLSNDAIYMSDPYKLTALFKSTLISKVVLIESPGILDFKVIKNKICDSQQQRPHTQLSNTSFVIENTGSNQSITEWQNMTHNRLIPSRFNNNNNNRRDDLFHSKYFVLFICGIVLISLILIGLAIIVIRSCLKTRKANTNQNKRKTIGVRNRLTINDKSKLILNKNINKTVCIEDLGSFSNNGFLDPQLICSNCPIKQTCSTCEDRDECLDKGICLSTYKLLA